MKKILFIKFILLGLFVNGQQMSSHAEYFFVDSIIKENRIYKSIETNLLDSNYSFTHYFNDDGLLTRNNRYNFYVDKNSFGMDTTLAGGGINYFTYNDLGKVKTKITLESINNEVVLFNEIIYKYDKKGEIISETFPSNYASKRVKEYYSYFRNDTSISKEINTYSFKNNVTNKDSLVKKKWELDDTAYSYVYWNNTLKSDSYSYVKDDTLRSYSNIYSNGSISGYSFFKKHNSGEYEVYIEFDSKGNKILKNISTFLNDGRLLKSSYTYADEKFNRFYYFSYDEKLLLISSKELNYKNDIVSEYKYKYFSFK